MEKGSMNKTDIFVYTQDIAHAHKCELLFLTTMGSRLYGTDTPTSDWDVKGIVLPLAKDLILQRAAHNINRKENQNSLGIDFELYSIQKYFDMLRTGETISSDMLWAHTNPEAIIYMNEDFRTIFNNYNKLIAGDRLDKNPYLRYAYAQAIKYGIKGNRFEVIRKVLNRAKKNFTCAWATTAPNYIKLEDYLDELSKAGEDEKYCFKTNIDVAGRKTIPGLYLAGKVHQGTITLSEFIQRCETLLKDYGERARLAATSGGNDWKSLSHAARSVFQLNELIKTGRINFPLAKAKYLCDIKEGKVAFDNVKETIEHNIEFFNKAIQVSFTQQYRWNQNWVDEFILGFYE
jgi:predicted nucleotidyltransferase